MEVSSRHRLECRKTEEFEGDFTVLYDLTVTNHKHGYNKMMHGKETVDSLSEFMLDLVRKSFCLQIRHFAVVIYVKYFNLDVFIVIILLGL